MKEMTHWNKAIRADMAIRTEKKYGYKNQKRANVTFLHLGPENFRGSGTWDYENWCWTIKLSSVATGTSSSTKKGYVIATIYSVRLSIRTIFEKVTFGG